MGSYIPRYAERFIEALPGGFPDFLEAFKLQQRRLTSMTRATLVEAMEARSSNFSAWHQTNAFNGLHLRCPSKLSKAFDTFHHLYFCDLSTPHEVCSILNFGYNESWEFETLVHQAFPTCVVHTLDCRMAGDVTVPAHLASYVAIHRLCLSQQEKGAQMFSWSHIIQHLSLSSSPLMIRVRSESYEWYTIPAIVREGEFVPRLIHVELNSDREFHSLFASTSNSTYIDVSTWIYDLFTHGGYMLVNGCKNLNNSRCPAFLMAKLINLTPLSSIGRENIETHASVEINYEQGTKLCPQYLSFDHIWSVISEGSEPCPIIKYGTGDEERSVCQNYNSEILLSLNPSGDLFFEKTMAKFQKVYTSCANIFYEKGNCNDKFTSFNDVHSLTKALQAINKTVALNVRIKSVKDLYPLKRILEISNNIKIMFAEICFSPPIRCIINNKVYKCPVNCDDYYDAYRWKNMLRNHNFTMRNWRRQHKSSNCIVATYERLESFPALPCQKCRYRFHTFNEGLGGTISQAFYGLVAAAKLNLSFCLSSGLIDPDPAHMNEYSWFRRVLPFASCNECGGVCDVDVTWHNDFWSNRNVPSQFKNLYPTLHKYAMNYINESKYNKHYENCVHVRTGDLREVPTVTWENKDIVVFGRDDSSIDIPFCDVNNCTFLTKGDVQSDFINLAGCKNIIYSSSSLSTVANIFSPWNYERLQKSRKGTEAYYGVDIDLP